MAETIQDRIFTAALVEQITGLSNRQINDWDGRGALPHARDAETGWRRFSPRDIFTVMVALALRRNFGVSVERVKFIVETMRHSDDDPLYTAAHKMATLGLGVWLMTDFEHYFVLDSELLFTAMWSTGFFGGEEASSMAFLKLNPLVNDILGSLDNPVHVPAHGKGYEVLQKVWTRLGVKSAGEFQVLQLIRSGDFKRIEVTAPDGEIETIKLTATPDATEKLADLLLRHDYQQLTVTKKDGRVVSIEQKMTVKPSTANQDRSTSP